MEETRTPVTARRSTAGRRFPADPPREEEIVAVMRTAGESPYAMRLRALTAAQAGVRRGFGPHQLRHAHAVEMAREGDPAQRDPAPARSREPWSNERLSAGDRHRGDRQHDPPSTSADRLGDSGAVASAVRRSAHRSASTPLQPVAPGVCPAGDFDRRLSFRGKKTPNSGTFVDAGGGTRTPDTRIMIGDKGDDLAYLSGLEVLLGAVSYARTREFGARLGAQTRRKRKKGRKR